MTARRRWLRRAAVALLMAHGAGAGAVAGAGARADVETGAGAGAEGRAGDAPWPVGPLRLVVAYPPGGVSDAAARALAQALEPLVGTTVLVEHRPGAGGAVALAALGRAAPDGRTLCLAAISPLTAPDGPPPGAVALRRQVAPVMALMATPVLVVGTPALPGEGFAALREAARRPQGLRWASSGPETAGHQVLRAVEDGLAGEVPGAPPPRIVHVPYTGGGQQLTDALAGQFEVLSTNVGPQQLRWIGEGRLKPLAVGAPRRLRALPGVPTLAELGLPRANLGSTFGLFAPAGTPAALLRRLNAVLNRALQAEPLQAALRAADNEPVGGDASWLAQRIADEAARRQAAR